MDKLLFTQRHFVFTTLKYPSIMKIVQNGYTNFVQTDLCYYKL